MKSTTWSLVWLVVTGCSGAATLDKNGTSGSQNDPMFTKMPEKQEPAEAGSFLTEREGFSHHSRRKPLRSRTFSQNRCSGKRLRSSC